MSLNRSWTTTAIAIAALLLVACQEDLKGGLTCPALCPEQSLTMRDTVLLASDVIQTMASVPGIPAIGTEPQLLLARYAQGGDSIVSVVVFRFDTLKLFYPSTDTTKPPTQFTSVDSTSLSFTVLPAPTGKDTIWVPDTVTFSVFDVDTAAADLDTAAVHAKFGGTLVGSLRLPRDSVKGIIRIPIDTVFLSARVATGHRVRLGVSATSPRGEKMLLASLGLASSSGALTTDLAYLGRVDTLKVYVNNAPVSHASASDPQIPGGPVIPALADFQMSFQGSPPVPPDLIAIGGLPSSRAYIIFNFPPWLVDSSTTVVRANLEIRQAAFTFASDTADSVFMQPMVTFASLGNTDPTQVVILGAQCTATPMSQAKLPPSGFGLDTISLVRTAANIFNCWRIGKGVVQRGVVLTLANEGVEPRALLFYSNTALEALRPRVRITYIPHSGIGQP